MFVTTPTQFYIARFLLAVFEAGFFPGIILYFTYWYPSVRRGQVIAIFMSATTIVSVIAGPLCGAILKYFDGVNGLAGWQWLFLVQGLPAAALGVVIYFYLQASRRRTLVDARGEERPASQFGARVSPRAPSDKCSAIQRSMRSRWFIFSCWERHTRWSSGCRP